jgi:hypothetical protein
VPTCCAVMDSQVSYLKMGGGVLPADMFAYNKSGKAYQERGQRPETVDNDKWEPQRQPGCH